MKAGFPGEKPEIHIEIPADTKASTFQKAGGEGGWIHISPFTTEDYKELPSEQLAELLNELYLILPDKRIILTCAGNNREKAKMSALLASLNFEPWRIFPGSLNLLEMAAIVQGSCCHIGGDSGGLHVAWMTGVPTVTWFRNYEGLADWRPVGPRHRSVIGERKQQGIAGIETRSLVSAAEELIAAKPLVYRV